MIKLLNTAAPEETAGYLVLIYILAVCSYYDIKQRIIPGQFITSGILIRLLFIMASGPLQQEKFISSVIWSAAGGLCIAAPMLVITIIYERLRHKKAIGGGDIKLLLVTGIYLGPGRNLTVLFIACMAGAIHYIIKIIFKRYKQPGYNTMEIAADQGKSLPADNGSFPWAPSIAAAALIVILSGLN